MRIPDPDPEDLSADPFLVTADGAPGLTAAQVRHPRFLRPSRGVRLPAGVEPAPELLARAALLTAPTSAALVDVSAARHWQLPLPPWIGLDATDDVSVAVPRRADRQRRTGVRGRRLTIPEPHLVTSGSIRVTTPARTWLDCAEFINVEHVVAMGDAILRRRLATDGMLAAMVRWGRGRRGVARARCALGLLDAASESPSESIVRCHLVLSEVPRPICNMDVFEAGQWLARVDMAWPECRVIVEYDGAHHGQEEQRRADAARRNLLQDAGWLVIVFTARDLRHPEQMAALVRSALRARRP